MDTILNTTQNQLKEIGTDLECMQIFSNSILRECGSQDVYEKICEAFRPVADQHIAVYGEYNDQRLTGLHETASINDFSMVFQTEVLLSESLLLL